MSKRIGLVLPTGLLAAIVLEFAAPPARAGGPTAAKIQAIAAAYAQDAVQNGDTVGIEIGVIYKNLPPQYIDAGVANFIPLHLPNHPETLPFTADAVFSIGSVSKVFTTNLLGQNVDAGLLQLSDPLSSFEAAIGTLPPLTAKVTLQDLGDFTGGFPDYPPLCTPTPSPGCIPSVRPTYQAYTAQDLAAYFDHAVPMNYHVTPAKPATQVPVPYHYSDFSIGLLGLLLGDPSNAPFTNAALKNWAADVRTEILTPLGMTHTYPLGTNTLPPNPPQIVQGFQPALATASVLNGEITSIALTSPGAGYASAPAVTIVGGGGSGATAIARLTADGTLKSIEVTHAGDDYIAPAEVTFGSGGAKAAVIVQNGKVVAFKILATGSGYTQAPGVQVTGGREFIGRDATGIAHLDDGRVSYIEVTGGGLAYVQPLSVIVAPGNNTVENTPVWAPAGAIGSSVHDMLAFASAALGNQVVNGRPVPAQVTKGFEIAETPYACSVGKPDLSSCPPNDEQSALAWFVLPADSDHHVPEIVGKDGGLPGFSTEVLLMPSEDIAVVVFANSRQTVTATGNPSHEAELVAHNVLYALYYGL